ncbi:MAG TPA: RidA family protein [Nitrospiraceae bacterium]|nr:RidA family protein [Nitrospiraceae bacterium]
MSHQGRMPIVSALFLLLAGCAGPQDRHDNPPPRPTMMPPQKVGASLGIPWEKEFKTMASVQARDMIAVAAQLGWDEQGIVKGETVEVQMRQAYVNIGKLLDYHGATIGDVIEEIVFVTDMKAALAVAQKVRHEVFGDGATVASSIVEVGRLEDPKALVAIRATAKLDPPMSRSRQGDPSDGRPRGGRSRGMGGGGIPRF